MATSFIYPRDLPEADSVATDSSITIDNGTLVERATPKKVVDAGRPISSESQAVAGVDNTTSMTPLTTKQAIDATTSGNVALSRAWAESATNPDPEDVTSKSAKTWAYRAEAVAPYNSRAEFEAATLSDTVEFVFIGGLVFIVDATGEAIASANGVKLSPWGAVYPEHYGAVGDGVADDTVPYKAALMFGQNGVVLGFPGKTYLITEQLEVQTGTLWDHQNSKLVAGAAASSSFFSLWKAENGAHEFKVLNQHLDGNNQSGMIGFISGTGTRNFIIDGFVVENCPHNPPTIDGGRGFNVESINTSFDNSNNIITNGIVRNCYMGFSMQSGDNYGNRHGIRISNIQVEACDVVWWAVGLGTYPFVADKMQFDLSNITAKNCGKASEYTNGGGAFCFDRACNMTMRNIVLSNDATYGSIPCVWHGNGANLQAEITYNGDCTNFWNFQPYKEDDAPPAAENTIQDSILTGDSNGTCVDIAVIGTITDSYAEKIHIKGRYKQVTSGNVLTANLRQDDVWLDVYEDTNNCRVIGRGDFISNLTFAAVTGRTAQMSETSIGSKANPTYSPTLHVGDTKSDRTGGLELSAFLPQLKFRDLSGSSYGMSLVQDGTVAKMSFDLTPATPAWTDYFAWDVFGSYSLVDKTHSSGKTTNRWKYVFSEYLTVMDAADAAPPTIAGHVSIYVDPADGDLKVKFGDGTVKTIVTDT